VLTRSWRYRLQAQFALRVDDNACAATLAISKANQPTGDSPQVSAGLVAALILRCTEQTTEAVVSTKP
jgi:hypothetical protein